jgi:murein L,D-transpeptidase YcbB/YkuD
MPALVAARSLPENGFGVQQTNRKGSRMSAPRTAIWLLGLGCLGLVPPAWATEALLSQEPSHVQDGAPAPGAVPQQGASYPAGAAPRVNFTFDGAERANRLGAIPAPEAEPGTTASTSRRAPDEDDLRTRMADQPAGATTDVPSWTPRRGNAREAAPRETPPAATPTVPAERATVTADKPAPDTQVDAPAAQNAAPAPAAATATPAAPVPAPAIVATPAVAPAPSAPVETAAPTAPAGTAVATQPSTPADALAVADPVAASLQARLAELSAALPRRLGKVEREALAAYYTATGFRPVWVAAGGWTRGAESVIARLKDAEADGLDPAEYPVPVLGLGGAVARSDNPGELAEAEIKLSAAALLYARDARGGRIDPTRLSALITPKLDLPGAEALMTRLAPASDPGAVLAGYQPAYPGYLALRAKLAELRANRPSTPMVRLPRTGPRSPKLASLDGSVPAPRLEGDILANMERWRWLPPEVGARYILVNIPQFKLDLIEDGRSVHETRVIVGKPEAATPVFSGEMEYAVVNPSWYIPPSIMKKEILPGLAADPGYAERRGYQVIRRGNQISVRQPPGERNALGFIKFMFPNQHSVYLHDTPNRNLFSASLRAFSHGCVRVDQPFALADFVLGAEWPEARLKRMIGRGERTIRMAAKLPVHLAYFTLTVDGSGDVKTYGDIYGINRRVRLALGLGS